MDSSDMGDVLYGPEGFSYAPRLDPSGSGRTLVRDAADDILLESQYVPDAEKELKVQFQAGPEEDLGVRELLDRGVIDRDDVYEQDMPSDDGFLGAITTSEVDDWTRRRYCKFGTEEGFTYTFTGVDGSEPTKILMEADESEVDGLADRAAEGLMQFADYTIQSHFEDPYLNDRKPYDPESEAAGLKTVGKRNILENVVETSLHLSGEVVEGNLESWME
ncbi:MAG: hypothetical protein ABEJ36_02015 [Candidatus Nanosalina sp.]